MCCRGAGVTCVGVGGPPAAWRAGAASALAVAFWMRSARRGGSEEEVENVGEDEDEEEVVVFGDVGRAVMRAGAALWAAAASAAPTAGRMEGISSGCRFGGGWLEGPGKLIWSAAVGRGCAGLRSPPFGFSWAGLLQCVRACGSASAGANSSRGLHSAAAGLSLRFPGCVWGVCVNHSAGWVCCGAWGSSLWVCVGCRVWGALGGLRREGLWRACVGGRAGGGGPCCGARGCARWWACVGRWVGTGEGGAGAGADWGGVGLDWRVFCRCTCPLAAARPSGLL